MAWPIQLIRFIFILIRRAVNFFLEIDRRRAWMTESFSRVACIQPQLTETPWLGTTKIINFFLLKQQQTRGPWKLDWGLSRTAWHSQSRSCEIIKSTTLKPFILNLSGSNYDTCPSKWIQLAIKPSIFFSPAIYISFWKILLGYCRTFYQVAKYTKQHDSTFSMFHMVEN